MTDRLTVTDAIPGGVSGIVRAVRNEPLPQSSRTMVDLRPDQEIAAQKSAAEMAQPPAGDSADLMEQMNRALSVFNIEARYYVDKSTNMKVVQIKDAQTHRLIRQVPSGEYLNHVRTLEELTGLIFDQKA